MHLEKWVNSDKQSAFAFECFLHVHLYGVVQMHSEIILSNEKEQHSTCFVLCEAKQLPCTKSARCVTIKTQEFMVELEEKMENQVRELGEVKREWRIWIWECMRFEWAQVKIIHKFRWFICMAGFFCAPNAFFMQQEWVLPVCELFCGNMKNLEVKRMKAANHAIQKLCSATRTFKHSVNTTGVVWCSQRITFAFAGELNDLFLSSKWKAHTCH